MHPEVDSKRGAALRSRGRMLAYDNLRQTLENVLSPEQRQAVARALDNYAYLLNAPALQAHIGQVVPLLACDRLGISVTELGG